MNLLNYFLKTFILKLHLSLLEYSQPFSFSMPKLEMQYMYLCCFRKCICTKNYKYKFGTFNADINSET